MVWRDPIHYGCAKAPFFLSFFSGGHSWIEPPEKLLAAVAQAEAKDPDGPCVRVALALPRPEETVRPAAIEADHLDRSISTGRGWPAGIPWSTRQATPVASTGQSIAGRG